MNEIKNFYNFLEEVGINYFACTIYAQENPIFSLCNNKEWFDLYQQTYLPEPPVQKHILSRSSGVIWWDGDLYDPETAHYIRERDKVCGTRIICTLLPSFNDKKAAFSLGSKYGSGHIFRVINNNQNILKPVFRGLLRL